MSRLARRPRGTAFSSPVITLAENNPLNQGGP
jgi:hypothetical protein